MARLSVSLESDQDEWLAEQKRELGVSKGKVVRECVDAVRTGDSLFTESVNDSEPADDDRLASLESRLAALETRLDGAESLGASEAVDDGTPESGNEDATVAEDMAAVVDDDVEPSEDVVVSTDDEATPASSRSAADAGGDDEADGESPNRVHIPGAVGDSASGTAASTDDEAGAATNGADPDDGTATTEASGGTSGEPTPRGRNLDDEDEMEKVEVDKSDPDAIRAHLQESVDDPALASAVFACWQQLRDRGTVHVRSMHGFHDDHPLGYDDERAWWREAVEPTLVTLPGVRAPEGNGKLFRFKY